jgi:hypothetical protein
MLKSFWRGEENNDRQVADFCGNRKVSRRALISKISFRYIAEVFTTLSAFRKKKVE